MKKLRRACPPVAVYQEHLNLRGHGTSMWSDAVIKTNVSLSDVGAPKALGVSEPFFIITLPRDHPGNQRRDHGVPDDFEVLELGSSDIQQTNDYLERGVIVASPGIVEMTSENSLRSATICLLCMLS